MARDHLACPILAFRHLLERGAAARRDKNPNSWATPEFVIA